MPHSRAADARTYFHAYYVAHRKKRNAQTALRQAMLAPAVYVWIAPDGQADYVGRGTLARAIRHRHTASWWTPEHYVLIMTCSTEWQAMELEGRWGGFYMPRHNKEGYRHAGLCVCSAQLQPHRPLKGVCPR